jgi:hypothetical protein
MAEQPKSATTPLHGPVRPRSSAPRTPAPGPRIMPLATAAHTRMPPRTTVATAAARLPAALSGASDDDARRPGGGICVRGCGRRRSVVCVSGVGECGVPRAQHAKVGGARQRATGRSRAYAARKNCGQRAPHMGGRRAVGEAGEGGSEGGVGSPGLVDRSGAGGGDGGAVGGT